jgi:hypothetical protein
MAVLGFLFGRVNNLLPGNNGVIKGLIFGSIGWLFMGIIFFPLIGLGPFAIRVGLGIRPALLSLVMLLTYSVVLGAFAALKSWSGPLSHSKQITLDKPMRDNADQKGDPNIPHPPNAGGSRVGVLRALGFPIFAGQNGAGFSLSQPTHPMPGGVPGRGPSRT